MHNTIMTKCGEIRGTTCQWEGVTAYKGIRYATAGRWEYPKAVTSWEGVYDASTYGNCCYQPRSFYDEEYNEKKLGKILSVLCEGFDPISEAYYGRSEADAPEIDGKIYFAGKKGILPGTFVDVKIDEVVEYDLYGTAINI